MKKLKQEEFIERANKIHNSKYTYDNTIYINTTTPVCITCPVHGNFWMKPELHLIGHGCPKCAKNGIKYTNDTFIEKSREIHGDKWNYDKVKYINSQTNVIINCPIHGDFIQKPQKHLQGHGCPICGKNRKIEYSVSNRSIYKNKFIEKAKELHGDKYNYDNIVYINKTTKIKLHCIEHGDFYITPISHLRGYECPNCTKERIRKKLAYTLEEYIETANNVHNNKYDYSLVTKYINGRQNIDILCPIHGKFNTNSDSHIRGHGCPICANENNISENKIFEFIKDNINETIERQKRFQWLNGKSLDIYIPSMNIAVEYQGKQHFEPVSIYGGEENYNKQRQRDIDKYNECKEHGIKLFYFSNERCIPDIYIDNIYTDSKKLLEAIFEYKTQKQIEQWHTISS